MVEELIGGIVYTELSEEIGPNPKIWMPENLSENVRMLASVKSITILSGEENFTPEEVIILPFPSINMKGLVKYIQWHDEERRGSTGRSTILLLFKEADDVIFYKYVKELEVLFNKYAEKLAEKEIEKAEETDFKDILQDFKAELIDFLEQLKQKELTEKEAFPEHSAITSTSTGGREFTFKIIVCGDPSVGKTSTILRFTHNAFNRTYMPTIGVNITEKFIIINDMNIKLILWDLAGQQKFETMRAHFYQGAEGLLLVYDVSKQKTFNSVDSWHDDIKKNTKREIPAGFMIANKCDLTEEREISSEDGHNLASNLLLKYYETSALTGDNIDEVFYEMARSILKSKDIDL